MRKLLPLAAALLLVGAAPSASAPSAHRATGSLRIDQSRFRFSAHGLSPGSYVGVLLAYRDYARTTARTSRVNVVEGVIQTGDQSYLYEVDEGGNVTVAGSLHLITGGVGPGRLVALLSDTAGEMADDEADVG